MFSFSWCCIWCIIHITVEQTLLNRLPALCRGIRWKFDLIFLMVTSLINSSLVVSFSLYLGNMIFTSEEKHSVWYFFGISPHEIWVFAVEAHCDVSRWFVDYHFEQCCSQDQLNWDQDITKTGLCWDQDTTKTLKSRPRSKHNKIKSRPRPDQCYTHTAWPTYNNMWNMQTKATPKTDLKDPDLYKNTCRRQMKMPLYSPIICYILYTVYTYMCVYINVP